MKFIFKLFTVFILVFTSFLILDWLYPLNMTMLNKPKSKILYDTNNQIVAMKISSDDIWRFEISKDEITQNLKQSTIYFEDRYFYYHFGINPFSMIRAFFNNLLHKTRIGASTITMQVARMMNPKKRNYKNKIIEIFNAFQLEWHYAKDEILTMYFNLAPYGGNIEGVKAASYFYFNRPINELSISQTALLSTIPKNPNKNRLDKSLNTTSLKMRLVRELYKNKIITKNQYERALKEPFKSNRHNLINLAPHYSNMAFANNNLHSNLNVDLQIALQRFLDKEIKNLKDKRVKNASAVLIDNYNMHVVAYVGSHDFNSKNGQNDGVKNLKNVGSTLKPFIYAKAMETGLITPKSKLIDTQLYYLNYTPENFSKEFIGIISAKDALLYSLNIPAVKLNSILKENSIYYLLDKAGLTKFDEQYYGESIALGGISLSLLELTHLYTIFANGGKLKPLEIAGDTIDKNIQLLSAQSAYLTAAMLTDAPRAYLDSVWKNTKNKPYIMFKTGTTAGARDLYTIALSPQFTLGIWLGNFDGTKTYDLSGGISAALVAFDMFDYIDKSYPQSKFVRPKGIEKKEVCTDAYMQNNCKDKQIDEVIKGVDINRNCEFYRNEELFFMLKIGYLNSNELQNTPCFSKFKDIKPVLNEIDNKNFTLTNSDKIRLIIKCTAVFGDEVYINIDSNGYIKKTNAKNFSYEFNKGYHKIECLDEHSNLTSAKFNVVEFK